MSVCVCVYTPAHADGDGEDSEEKPAQQQQGRLEEQRRIHVLVQSTDRGCMGENEVVKHVSIRALCARACGGFILVGVSKFGSGITCGVISSRGKLHSDIHFIHC